LGQRNTARFLLDSVAGLQSIHAFTAHAGFVGALPRAGSIF
jgi:hypothetical protein